MREHTIRPSREERVAREPEHPLRLAELGLARTERLDAPLAEAVEVPPPGPIRDEVKVARGTPRGLEDRLDRELAGHESRVGDRPVGGEVADPELAPIPRHPGEIPRGPRELRTVGCDAGRRVEVAAAGDDRGFGRTVGRQHHELVHDLFALVTLADADPSQAVGRDPSVRVSMSALGLRRDRRRLGARILPVEALILEATEDQAASMDRVRPAPVLMDPGPDVEAFRGHVDRGRVRIAGDHDRATCFGRAHLRPPQQPVLEPELTEPDSRPGEQRCGDRRRPAPVRSLARLGTHGFRPTITRVTRSGPPFVLLTSRKPPRR